MIFLRRGIFFFLSQIGTVADSRDLHLRKRASRFKFWAVAARKNYLVFFTYIGNRAVFEPPHKQLAQFRKILGDDRNVVSLATFPLEAEHDGANDVALPPGREDEFALWIYRDPNRCPGFRLNHELFRSVTANYQDVPEASDFTDLALTFALPYVDAATLDRRIRDYRR